MIDRDLTDAELDGIVERAAADMPSMTDLIKRWIDPVGVIDLNDDDAPRDGEDERDPLFLDEPILDRPDPVVKPWLRRRGGLLNPDGLDM